MLTCGFDSGSAHSAALTLRSQTGLKCDSLHSDLSQSRRDTIMAAFRQGRIKVLFVSQFLDLFTVKTILRLNIILLSTIMISAYSVLLVKDGFTFECKIILVLISVYVA